MKWCPFREESAGRAGRVQSQGDHVSKGCIFKILSENKLIVSYCGAMDVVVGGEVRNQISRSEQAAK